MDVLGPDSTTVIAVVVVVVRVFDVVTAVVEVVPGLLVAVASGAMFSVQC